MLSISIDNSTNIVTLQPEGVLTALDFEAAANTVDRHLQTQPLAGLIIYSENFPGWESFAAMLAHFNFVRDHHRELPRVALVTDSVIADFAEKVAGHFISAEIKHYRYDELAAATEWLRLQ